MYTFVGVPNESLAFSGGYRSVNCTHHLFILNVKNLFLVFLRNNNRTEHLLPLEV